MLLVCRDTAIESSQALPDHRIPCRQIIVKISSPLERSLLYKLQFLVFATIAENLQVSQCKLEELPKGVICFLTGVPSERYGIL